MVSLRSILLNRGACLNLELLLQSVKKGKLPKVELGPAELLFSLTMGGPGENQTPESGTLVWVLEAEEMNP